MAHTAETPGTCQRCKGEITPGERFNRYNRPFPGALFHVACPDGKGETQEPQETRKARTPAAPGSIDAMIDARIEAMLGNAIDLDADSIKALIRSEITASSPVTTIEVKRPDGSVAEYKGEHYLFARLCKLLASGIDVALYGPAGTGKTTAALHAAGALGRKVELDTLDPSTPKSAILGYRTPTGEPVWTATLRMYAEGGIIVWDEGDNAPAHVQTLGNSLLANGHAPAAWGLVNRHDDFGMVVTANTPFRPTPRFPDRRPGSAAFVDRLYLMYWPLDPNVERRACGRPMVAAPARAERTCSAEAWGEWVERVREWTDANAPTIQVTPRATLTGLKALAAGETPAEVADGLVFRGADEALKARALTACPLP